MDTIFQTQNFTAFLVSEPYLISPIISALKKYGFLKS